MRRRLSGHARQRTAEREIPEGRIWAVVEGGRRRALEGGRWAARAVVDGIDTEVIFVMEPDALTREDVVVVITCYDERSERWRPVVEP